MKEKYKAYLKYLRDFPQTHHPEVDENGEAIEAFNLPAGRFLYFHVIHRARKRSLDTGQGVYATWTA